MSYILDSLKKSDKERRAINNPTTMVVSSPAFLENDKRPQINPLIWIFLVLIVLAFIFYFGFFWNADSQSVTISVQSKPIIRKEIVTASSPITSREKQEAILLYEQALKQKSKPEIDSLYKELTNQAVLKSQKLEGPELSNVPIEQALEKIELSSANEALTQAATNAPPSEIESAEVIIPSIYNLNRNTKKNIPSIDYGAHIYATDNKSGFVILNGARRRVGDKLSNGIYVEKIAENAAILSYNGTVFSLPAMKSWTGE